MIMMTESKLEEHINSRDWLYTNTKYRGSEDYDSHIGLLRVMFRITEDPIAITTLVSPTRTEVWTKNNNAEWEQVFDANSTDA